MTVRARVDGVMREIGSITGTQAQAVTSRLKIMGGLDIAERRAPQDGRVSVRRGGDAIDVRIAVLPTTHGEKMTLRILAQGEAPDVARRARDVAAQPRTCCEHAITQPFGAVVVVGPTGSGKTTTLYAALQELNTPDVSIVTIEDPVEYRAAGLDQIEVNARAGLTFANGLRTILRSDPDVILVGEIRDEETAQIAFRAAMTGHLVLTTLHAQTAAAAIQRLVDMDVDRGHPRDLDQLHRRPATRATGLRRAAPSRTSRTRPSASGSACRAAWGDVLLHRAVGCVHCGGDRATAAASALFEVMPMTDEIALLVGAPVARDRGDWPSPQGMFTLRDDGMRLCRRRRDDAGRDPPRRRRRRLSRRHGAATLAPWTAIELEISRRSRRSCAPTPPSTSTSSAISTVLRWPRPLVRLGVAAATLAAGRPARTRSRGARR